MSKRSDTTKTEVFYLDERHNIVDEKTATKVVIRECDENGSLIREVFGYTDRMVEKQRMKEMD